MHFAMFNVVLDMGGKTTAIFPSRRHEIAKILSLHSSIN
jgi:hypothetical protein